MDTYDINYYECYVYPALNDIWFSYYIKNDMIESYDLLNDYCYYIFKILDEEYNQNLKNLCNDIVLDIFHFIICNEYEFENYRSLIEDDYNDLVKQIKYHRYLKKTLYSIFYSIVYFVALKKNLLNYYSF